MRRYHLLVGWLFLTSAPLAAQIDPCDYPDRSIVSRVSPFCLDTASAKLASALEDVYRRAVASLTDPTTRTALQRSQEAFVSYMAAQEKVVLTLGGSPPAVRMSMMRGRIFFLQKLLGEWTELDEAAARATMKSDLRKLVTAEEKFFADSVKYTTRIGHGGLDYEVSPRDSLLSLRLTRDGWVATVGNAGTKTVCAMFIGPTPIAPAVAEGEPACH